MPEEIDISVLNQLKAIEQRSFIAEKWAQMGYATDPDGIPLTPSGWRLLVAQILLWQGHTRLEKSSAFQLVAKLESMGLLVIEALAATTDGEGRTNLNLPDMIVARRLLEEYGLSRQQAQGCLLNMCWAARKLHEQYGVRIRRYPDY
ncbi:MAG: hypothetical protein PVF49_01495 [Anaerolineales bacterium]|jgi:hypothetical protein